MISDAFFILLIEDAVQKVRSLARDDILDRVERADKNMNRVRAVFRYDRRLPNISAILVKIWKTMVDDDRKLKEVFQNLPWHASGEEKTSEKRYAGPCFHQQGWADSMKMVSRGVGGQAVDSVHSPTSGRAQC